MDTEYRSALSTLRGLARARSTVERCDFCGQYLHAGHRHLFEVETRRLLCVCDACTLFGGTQNRYRPVPRRVCCLTDFRMSEEQWNALMIPIELAFFYRSSAAGRLVAFYPSPAGPTESLLDLRSWHDLVRDNPVLADLEPDVESLLVNRLDNTRDFFVAPLDECYRLVGIIRTHWRGLSGGVEAWQEIRRFFDDLRRRALRGGIDA